jgi:predicted dehydrogenase
MHISSRRHFLKNAAILAPVLSFLPTSLLAGTNSRLRIAFIGAGPWGQQYLSHALQHKQLDVRAICDSNPIAIKESLKLFNYTPDVYDNYTTLLERKDIDAVLIAAPWHLHYEIAKAAMLAGKHVACGTVMGTTVAEHLDIVRISKKTGRHYFTLDESSYRRDLMAVSNMVDKGVFGTLETVQAGASHHDLNTLRNAAYPVYPAAAVARVLDKPTYVSVRATEQKQQYVTSNAKKLLFSIGMTETITLTTAKGQTVRLQSGVGKTEAVSTGFHIQGTEGSWMDLTRSIYIKGKSSPKHIWDADKPYLQQYDHPEWSDPFAMALQDFLAELKQPSRSVYTAAANSVIGPLAALSAKRGGIAVDFPDFNNA